VAQNEGTRVVLNQHLLKNCQTKWLNALHIITPNEREAEMLTGVEVVDEASAKLAATILKERGVKIVIITMSSKGAYVLIDSVDQSVPCPKIKAVGYHSCRRYVQWGFGSRGFRRECRY